jgi:hypothetical protein
MLMGGAPASVDFSQVPVSSGTLIKGKIAELSLKTKGVNLEGLDEKQR